LKEDPFVRMNRIVAKIERRRELRIRDDERAKTGVERLGVRERLFDLNVVREGDEESAEAAIGAGRRLRFEVADDGVGGRRGRDRRS